MVCAVPHRPRRWGPALAVLATVVLGACATGERGSLQPEATAVGNPAVDAVLSRLLGVPEAVYTAGYESVVAFDGSTTSVTATQASPARHALSIGDVRYVVDGVRVETCEADDECMLGHDAALVSNTLLAPDFFATNVVARLRRDVTMAIGPAVASTEDFDGRTATCVTIPLPAPQSAPESAPQSTYCTLDNGVLTRLDNSDLQVSITSYADTPDEPLLATA